ncbi:VOC family protein [Hyphomonas pacifica]|uniref:Uncharacterized protein n=1 Tax=Hyphomonas pacifica TaxID=1280941 RepID=A0A062U0I9_9PROT|nr:VOC family protein [Hyphomonas pacifica]KCZ49447.1 hypothetical protein HY2_03400 [Hyphomonas pacifica]RAN33253.1 hypothetical protein HY3_02565 [Hyphomonas pacifica]
MPVPRIRQLVIAAKSLETADQLGELLGLGEPFIDPGVKEFGLENRVYAMGDQFLEVVVPMKDDAPAQRFITRCGEGGYMAIFQTPQLDAFRSRVDSMGIRRVWNIDLPDISASHLHPADMGGTIVSVDEARPLGSWRWGGPDWRERSVPGGLVSMAVETPDPDGLASRWALALGLIVDRRTLYVKDGAIIFREGPVERLAAFGIHVADRAGVLARAQDMGLDVDGFEIRFAGVGLSLLD